MEKSKAQRKALRYYWLKAFLGPNKTQALFNKQEEFNAKKPKVNYNESL